MLQEQVALFYKEHGIRPDRPVGVAFSGGPDSVALLAATAACGYRCVALHCNFHLRGEESVRDEEFARRTARQLGCGFRKVDFDVDAHRALTGESLEMACRTLRYEWFASQLATNADTPCLRLQCIALGHHADDSVETMMLNLTRGTGLRGLSGIPATRDGYVRPLLGVSRADITGYLEQEGLTYVTDSTNLLTDCRRNVWRNILLPRIREEFPMFPKGVLVTAANLADDHRLLQRLIAGISTECTAPDGSIWLDKVRAFGSEAPALLWHMLQESGNGGCDRHTVLAILRSAESGASGKVFHTTSDRNRWMLDRNRLIPVTGNTAYTSPTSSFHIDIDEAIDKRHIDTPLPLTFFLVSPRQFAPEPGNRTLWLDYDALRAATPAITLRRWAKGDRMAPLGLRGSKLVSDLFTGARLNLQEKDHQWLLAAGETILWLPGIRSSRHFALTELTKFVLRIDLRTPTETQLVHKKP